MLVRGNNRTARVFELAWLQYLTMKDPYEKSQPGKCFFLTVMFVVLFFCPFPPVIFSAQILQGFAFILSHLLILLSINYFVSFIPGKDQNHVLNAMRIGRGTFGLKYAYFSSTTTPLLDKLVYKEGNTIELGGEVNKSSFQIAYV